MIKIKDGEKRLFEADGEFTIHVENGVAYVTPITPCFIDYGNESLRDEDEEECDCFACTGDKSYEKDLVCKKLPFKKKD